MCIYIYMHTYMYSNSGSTSIRDSMGQRFWHLNVKSIRFEAEDLLGLDDYVPKFRSRHLDVPGIEFHGPYLTLWLWLT